MSNPFFGSFGPVVQLGGVAGIGGNDAFTTLLLHCDGTDASTTFTDSSPTARTITTVGNAQIDTAQSVFGGASGLFDGTGDKLTAAASADWSMDGDWTWDSWVRFNASGRTFLLDAGNTLGIIGVTPSSGLVEVFAAAGTIISAGSTAFNTGQWYHLAVVRNGTSWVFYRDGTSYQTATSSATFGANTTLNICDYVDGALALNGWIDEYRVSKGIARWTTGFTPPTEPYDAG